MHHENDHLTPPAVLADWLASIGGGELVVVQGADHFLRTQAEEAADVLAEFLLRVIADGSPVESRP